MPKPVHMPKQSPTVRPHVALLAAAFETAAEYRRFRARPSRESWGRVQAAARSQRAVAAALRSGAVS